MRLVKLVRNSNGFRGKTSLGAKVNEQRRVRIKTYILPPQLNCRGRFKHNVVKVCHNNPFLYLVQYRVARAFSCGLLTQLH